MGLLVLVSIGAIAAVLFAPRKPAAPPVSRTTVAERPVDRVAPPASTAAPVAAPAPLPSPTPAAAPAPAATPEEEGPPAPVGAFRISGTVKERDTQKPLAGVIVLAVGTASTEEGAEAGRLEYRAATNTAGEFEIGLPTAGDFRIVIPGREELPEQRRRVAKYEAAVGALNEANPRVQHDVLIDLQAAITGKVTETGGSTPAPEVTVVLLDASATNTFATFVTGTDGLYEIGVDKPGDYAVRVDLEKSPYRMGKVVPFRRVKVPEVDSVVENIDFEVDPAGIVWGYVTTPKGDAVPDTEVVLCTSESPITQFVTAALRRTPPINSRTQPDGYYELLGIPLNQEWQLYATSNSKAPQLAQPFVLTPSTRTLRVDVYMFPGSRVSGVVVDNRGRQVPEARLRCIPSLTSLSSPLQNAFAFRDVRADANGEFVLEEVPAGSYNLYPQKQGFKFDTSGTPIYPDGYSELTGVTVTLYPIEAGAHEIFGVVHDPAGDGIGGVTVTLRGLALDSMTRIEQSTTTSGKGEFRFTNMPAGRYGAVFTKDQYGTVRRSSLALDRQNRILMSQASVVRGRVLVRETNQPPLTYNVQAIRTASYNEGRGRSVVMSGNQDQISGTFSNPDGSFELYLSPGDYMLMGTSEGLTSGRAYASVEPGVDVGDVLITLSQTGGTIAGRVRTLSGISPQGALARLVDTSGGIAGALEGGGPITTEFTVGEDGLFRFEQLPAGQYIVTVEHPQYAKASSEPISLGDAETRDDIEITLGSGGVLTGHVCRGNGNPWPGAQIFIASADNQTVRDAVADEQGYFVIDGLGSGEYQVTATSLQGMDLLGSDRLIRSVTVQEGQTSDVDFCSEGIRVTGMCSPPPGGLTIAQIFFRQPGSATIGEQLSGNLGPNIMQQLGVLGGNGVDSNTGLFEVPGLAAGPYQVEVVYIQLLGGDGSIQPVHLSYIELDGSQPVVHYDPEITIDDGSGLTVSTGGF